MYLTVDDRYTPVAFVERMMLFLRSFSLADSSHIERSEVADFDLNHISEHLKYLGRTRERDVTSERVTDGEKEGRCKLIAYVEPSESGKSFIKCRDHIHIESCSIFISQCYTTSREKRDITWCNKE